MKRKYFVIILLFNTFVTVCSIFVIQACVKKENKNSLENTEWKLVSIVDYINNTIKIPEPNKDNNFIVKFQANGLASGYSSSNTINGTYNVDYKSQTIKISIDISTFVEESPDGYAFLQYIIKVDKFVLDDNILKLYYNNQIYLEFYRR